MSDLYCLLMLIEQKRKELCEILSNNLDLQHPDTIKASKELDKALNDYYKRIFDSKSSGIKPR